MAPPRRFRPCRFRAPNAAAQALFTALTRPHLSPTTMQLRIKLCCEYHSEPHTGCHLPSAAPAHAPTLTLQGQPIAVHRLVAFIHFQDPEAVAAALDRRLEASHLCHQGHRFCANPRHLVLEPHAANLARAACSLLGPDAALCQHRPPCLQSRYATDPAPPRPQPHSVTIDSIALAPAAALTQLAQASVLDPSRGCWLLLHRSRGTPSQLRLAAACRQQGVLL
jgi:hypothetical protein